MGKQPVKWKIWYLLLAVALIGQIILYYLFTKFWA